MVMHLIRYISIYYSLDIYIGHLIIIFLLLFNLNINDIIKNIIDE